jgi:hypothetical protein
LTTTSLNINAFLSFNTNGTEGKRACRFVSSLLLLLVVVANVLLFTVCDEEELVDPAALDSALSFGFGFGFEFKLLFVVGTGVTGLSRSWYSFKQTMRMDLTCAAALLKDLQTHLAKAMFLAFSSRLIISSIRHGGSVCRSNIHRTEQDTHHHNQ